MKPKNKQQIKIIKKLIKDFAPWILFISAIIILFLLGRKFIGGPFFGM